MDSAGLPGFCDCMSPNLVFLPLPSSDARGIFKGEKHVSPFLASFSPLNRLFFRLFLLATQKKGATRNHRNMDLEDRKRFLLHQLRHSLTSDEYSTVLELLNYCLEQQYITAMGFSYLRVLDLYHMQESQ